MKNKPRYACNNCLNLKTRVVNKSNLGNIKEGDVKGAIKAHDTESLNLTFPFNFILYKRLKKYDECRIIYCGEHMLKRDLYIDRNNASRTIPTILPCPKYK